MAMTTSSSEVLPARSPRPLMVHSIWSQPSWTAASELATARPRSLWQWMLRTTLPILGTFSQVAEAPGDLLRRRVAHRVGDVDGAGAGVDGRLDDVAHEVEVGARAVLGRELD